MSRSEFDFISLVRARSTQRTRRGGERRAPLGGLVHGIGDDAAVIRQSARRDTVITADLLVEDVDFRRDAMPPRLLGHRALAVSLSDIAAMGARPRWALLSIGVPEDIWNSDYLRHFYAGFDELAAEHSVTLVGGDLSRTPERIVCDSIVLGETPQGRCVLRSGARPGDLIFVTGTLGGAAQGLQLLETGARLDGNAAPAHTRRRTRAASSSRTDTLSEARQQLMLRQLRPVPRVEWGLLLGEKRLATAMIDLSDGLSSDLAHLCLESGVGASIDSARLPLDSSLAPLGVSETDALAFALHGGEDYELLFTVPPGNVSKLPDALGGIAVTCIGEINREAKITLLRAGRTSVLAPSGFQHFRRTRRTR